jgi:outer membrane usher protein
LDSFDYDPHLVASASMRGGIMDWATLEGHVEGGAGLENGGLGVTIGALQRAVIDASIAGSHFGRDNGLQFGLGVSTGLFGATLDVSSQHALFDYLDLAAVTAPPGQTPSVLANLLGQGLSIGGASPLLLSTSVAPPRALDRASLSIPNVFGAASLNLSFVNQVDSDGTVSRIASVGVSHNFKFGLSTFATAFADVANKKDYGVVAGLSYSFGKDVSASTQSSLQSGGLAQTTQVQKSAGQDVGDYGWSVQDQEGVNRFVQAGAAYQTSVGRATATVDQYGAGKGASATGSADFSGSAVLAGGGVSLAPHIADSFAVVQAGAPGVTVLEDNRVLGKTDSSGRLLAPNLRSFQDNKISIDPTSLPLDAQSSATEMTLRPRAQSGVVADFRVRARARDAEIILVDEAGKPLPPGAEVERAGHPPALVGYDGRAYLSDLDARNVVTARVNGKTCAGAFDFVPARGRARPTIGPVACKG